MRILLLSIIVLSTTAFAQYQPHAIWSREGAGDSSLYGTSILALGDQNGDHFNDWAVFASGWGGPGGVSESKVEFFHGGNPPEIEPYMVRVTQIPIERNVWGARTLGDLNGDGFVDWAIIVELTDDPQQRDIYKIYFGGPGPHEVPDLVLTAPILSSLRGIGDFNGDDFDDLMLTDLAEDRALVYYGGNPMDTLPDWIRNLYLGGVSSGNLNGDHFADLVTYESNYIGIYFGAAYPDTSPAYHWSISGSERRVISDLNGDGFDDLCLSQSGWGDVLYGGLLMDSIEDAHLNFPCSGGPEPGGPEQIVSAGDFNGDRIGDVIMFTHYCPDSYGGTLTLHLGSRWLNTTPTNPTFVIYGWTEPFNLIHFKTAVSLGDVNGDGVDDLAIGANGGIEQVAWRGKVVILGGDTSLHVDADEPRATLPQSLDVSAYPNPFNNSTTVRISLPPYHGEVDLRLFNLLGQEVRFVRLGNVSASVEYRLDAPELATGLYLLRVYSGGLQSTTKLMLMR